MLTPDSGAVQGDTHWKVVNHGRPSTCERYWAVRRCISTDQEEIRVQTSGNAGWQLIHSCSEDGHWMSRP